MNFPARFISLCRQLSNPAFGHSKARHPGSLEFQRLEPRVLLAGDVTVFVDANFTLNIIGDAADNQVQIIGGRNSSAQVLGLNGTTINGNASAFDSGFGLRGLQAQMNGGNDELDLHAGRFSFVAQLDGNGGGDSIRARNSNLFGLHVRGGEGNDLVQIENVFAVQSSNITTGEGRDVIAIYNHAAGDDIIIRAGEGDDTLAVDRMGMFDQLDAEMGQGNDQFLIAGRSFIGRDSRLELGTGNDFLGILPNLNNASSQIQKNTSIEAGNQNDLVALGSGVTTHKGTQINGDQGEDSFDNAGADLIDTSILNFQNQTADTNAALDSLYTELAGRGLDPTLFGSTKNYSLGIDLNSTPLTYTENDPAIAIASDLEIRGGADTVITSASVQIDGFVSGQDILEFNNVGTVTGAFDGITGILTFSGNGNTTQYQTALRSVRYLNTSNNPVETTRTLQFEIENSESQTATASRVLNVIAQESSPEIILSESTLEFDIDNPNLSRPIALDPNLLLEDFDAAEITSATVQIVGGGQAGDTLNLATIGSISASYDPASGLLAISGTATLAEYQDALRNVTFNSSTDRAPLGLRTIRFETTDGQKLVSATMTLDVEASQTIGVITTQSDLNYEETQDPTEIDLNVTLTTGGNPSAVISGATVSITSGFSPEHDQLVHEPVSGINSNYDQSAGILTFTGDASAEVYQTLLRNVKYFNDSFGDFDFSTNDRVVQFAVERNGLTAVSTRTIEVTEITSEQALISRYLEVNDLVSEVTPSGLHYIVTQEGNGNFPNENSSVTVNYVGTLLNGQEFDANDDITFSLQQVIEGWTEGIPKFSVGGSGILIIPSDLAYGPSSPSPSIPPNSILRFDVDLLDFN